MVRQARITGPAPGRVQPVKDHIIPHTEIVHDVGQLDDAVPEIPRLHVIQQRGPVRGVPGDQPPVYRAVSASIRRGVRSQHRAVEVAQAGQVAFHVGAGVVDEIVQPGEPGLFDPLFHRVRKLPAR